MANLRFVVDYLKHRMKAHSRHGVHSPFVYKLIDEVIYNFQPQAIYQPIEHLRQRLLQDDSKVFMVDLGAGTRTPGSAKLKETNVKRLAAYALKPPHLAQLIYRLAHFFQPKNVLELGTCLGITTAYLAKATPHASITTIEGCPQIADVANKNFLQLGIHGVNLKIGNFNDLLPAIVSNHAYFDFVFIDGNHRKEATTQYFEALLPKLGEDSCIIFDDIYWSLGMKEAWKQIKNHPQVTLTLDLFWMGLVFFRSGQAKQHFKVKF